MQDLPDLRRARGPRRKVSQLAVNGRLLALLWGQSVKKKYETPCL